MSSGSSPLVLCWKRGSGQQVEPLHGGPCRSEKPFGLAHLDLSTGEFRVTEIEEWEEVLDELGRINPAELLLLEKDDLALRKGLSTYRLEVLAKENFHEDLAESL